MTQNSEQSLLEGGWSRLVIGAAIAMLSAQIMIQHATLTSVNGVFTLAAGLVVWAFGMTLTLQPTVNELGKLREAI